jgi:hypothetical protein
MIKIQGHSDDVLNVYYENDGCHSADEFYVDSKDTVTIEITDIINNTFVIVTYTVSMNQYGVLQ